MNTEQIIQSLEVSKRFVVMNASGINEDKITELQSILSQAIQATRENDDGALDSALSELDQLAPHGWDLSSQVRLLIAGSEDV